MTSPRRARSFAMNSANAAGESLLGGTAPVARILSRVSAWPLGGDGPNLLIGNETGRLFLIPHSALKKNEP